MATFTGIEIPDSRFGIRDQGYDAIRELTPNMATLMTTLEFSSDVSAS